MTSVLNTIRLVDIAIKSVINPHPDLPLDMKLSAQIVVNGKIFVQTLPFGAEGSQNFWKMRVDCKVPPHALTFGLAIMRHKNRHCIRLLGSTNLDKAQVLLAVGQKICFQVLLKKVNPDGPSLECTIGFSVEPSSTAVPLLDIPGHPLHSPVVGMLMERRETIIRAFFTGRKITANYLELREMHESILLLGSTNQDRPGFLKALGDIYCHCYETIQTIDDLDQAISAYEDAVRDCGTDTNHLGDLGNALRLRFERLGDVGDINRSVSFCEKAAGLNTDGSEDPLRLSDLGKSLLRRFERLAGLDDIEKSVLVLQKALDLVSDQDPDKSSRLSDLGNSLLRRFLRLGASNDINKSVMLLRNAVSLTPSGDSRRVPRLNNLGNCLRRRFMRFGNLSDINDSVSVFKEAVALTPDSNPNKPPMVSDLGNSLLRRFKRLDDLADITDSVEMFKEALRLSPNGDPYKPSLLSNLGNALRYRFQRLGNRGDIHESIVVYKEAVSLTPDGHADKPSMRENVANCLLERFLLHGEVDDINESMVIFNQNIESIPDGHPDKASAFDDLGRALFLRFERLGDIYDIEQSVSQFQTAVRLTPDDDPDKVACLSNLANSLLCRFERIDNLDDIDKALSIFQEAVDLLPEDHPNKPLLLTNLANAMSARFKRLGDLEDMNKSLSFLRKAVLLTPNDHVDKALRLGNLGGSLVQRFKTLGDFGDIEASVFMFKDAVRFTPYGHPVKVSHLTGLGVSLSLRLERLPDLDRLNESVSVLEHSLKLTPGHHPDKASRLRHLAISLHLRCDQLGDLEDIDESVRLMKEAVKLSPDNHPEKPGNLNVLAISLAYRFMRRKNPDDIDIDESVLVFKAAIALVPDGHPRKPCISSGLAHSLFLRFIRFGDPQDRTDMFVQFQYAACAGTGPTSLRFVVSSRWAQLAQVFQHPSTLEAYNVALGLLPQLAWLGLSISDRHHHILQAGTVVRDAGAAAIAACQYEKAVEWLEQGRSVIWGQILDLRTSVDTLRYRYPGLADELVSLSTQLEGAGIRETSPKLVQASAHGSIQSIADLHHHHAHKREDLLKTIRALEGFERFLLPKPISELLPGAQGGPVVILNISGIRCDGLVLRPGLENIILHVALPNCTQDNVRKMIESLQHLLHNTGCSERLTGQREGHVYVPPETRLSDILSELWSRIARPVLDALAIKIPSRDSPQRIWWCPTGPLAFLPLHAAGVYGENEAFGTKLSDFVISSYTPSLTALIQGFRSPSRSQDELQLLAVAQPSADGQNCIPGTQEELDHIQWLAKGKVPILRLEGNSASLRSVQEGMKKSRWVHFACHGVQDVSHPTESALLLAGSSRLTLSNIIQLSLPNAEFAFLSACQTATGAKDLQEESVHLAAGMLLAGYRGVIATMWSIMDNDAPQVAADVYEHLFKTSPPDPTRAAEALHLAVRKLREGSGRKKSLFRWVPFIHVGV